MTAYRLRNATIEDAYELARILIETNKATFRGLVPDKCLTSFTIEESAANWQRSLGPGGLKDGQFLLVAENEKGGMIGYALAGSNPAEDGFERELNVLMVDTSWQRQGIGRALVAKVAVEVKNQGVSTLLVGILFENPNRFFYERLGGQLIGSRPYDWDGYKTTILLYGWDNIQDLVDLEVNK